LRKKSSLGRKSRNGNVQSTDRKRGGRRKGQVNHPQVQKTYEEEESEKPCVLRERKGVPGKNRSWQKKGGGEGERATLLWRWNAEKKEGKWPSAANTVGL